MPFTRSLARPGANLFKMLDKKGDGVVTKEEAGAFPAGGRQAAAGSGAATVKRPPAENFKPRPHGEEAKAAGLKPDVLARIDVEMQRHVAAPDVAGIVALVSRHRKTGYFETFGMQDLEAGKPMPRDAIFRLQSMTKPIVAVAAPTAPSSGLTGRTIFSPSSWSRRSATAARPSTISSGWSPPPSRTGNEIPRIHYLCLRRYSTVGSLIRGAPHNSASATYQPLRGTQPQARWEEINRSSLQAMMPALKLSG